MQSHSGIPEAIVIRSIDGYIRNSKRRSGNVSYNVSMTIYLVIHIFYIIFFLTEIIE